MGEVEQTESGDWESEGRMMENRWRKGTLDFAEDGLVMGMLFDVIETWQAGSRHKGFRVYWEMMPGDP